MLVWCVYSCVRPCSVYEVVLISYVVGAVSRVLLFVLDGSMLRECESDRNAGVGDG